jgi:serine/threonine protein kinase
VAQVIWFDCKSQNILLDNTGTVAKLSDVGISKVMLQHVHTGLHGGLPQSSQRTILPSWNCSDNCRGTIAVQVTRVITLSKPWNTLTESELPKLVHCPNAHSAIGKSLNVSQ